MLFLLPLSTIGQFVGTKVIFQDTFEDNNNQWRPFYSKIKKGRYIVETIGKDAPAISTLPIAVEEGRDYVIDITMSWEWNRSKELMGIVWNKGYQEAYYLGFNKLKQMTVFKIVGGETEVLETLQETNVLSEQYVQGRFQIACKEGDFFIEINGNPVYHISEKHEKGNHIGFFVGKASELKVTKMKVSYLD